MNKTYSELLSIIGFSTVHQKLTIIKIILAGCPEPLPSWELKRSCSSVQPWTGAAGDQKKLSETIASVCRLCRVLMTFKLGAAATIAKCLISAQFSFGDRGMKCI